MRVLMVDDHDLVINALKFLLEVMAPGLEADLATNLGAASTHLGSNKYDLVLLDWKLAEGVTGDFAIEHLREQGCEAPIVILSGEDSAEVIDRAIELGAVGFIPKWYSQEMMTSALDDVLAGRIFLPSERAPARPEASGQSNGKSYDALLAELTPRQLAVYMAATRGLSNKLIARELGVEASTVKSHLSAIYSTLGVRNRTEAAYQVSREGRQHFPALRR